MDFVYLIKLIIAGKKREKSEYFEVDASHSPVVHFVIVIAIG